MARDTDLGMEAGTEKDAAYDKLKSKQEKSDKAKGVLRGAGYARGGGVSPEKAVHKHESHLHKGKTKTKFKAGGKVDGKKPAARADKFSRGGSKPRGHTKININVGAGEAEKKQAMAQGVQMGARMAAAKMAPPKPPMPAPRPGPQPGMGSPPPGGPPPGMGAPPQPGMKRGGKVGPVKVAGIPHLKGGAGGAKGRLSKMASYGTKPKA